MNMIVKAGMDDLIWLVGGLFWVIAQIAGAAAKKKQPPRPRSSGQPPHEKTNDPFADLMQQIGGAQRFDIPTIEEEPVEEEKPINLQWKPVISAIQVDHDSYTQEPALPKTELTQNITAIEEASADPSLPNQRTDYPNTDVRPKMSQFRSSIPAVKLPPIPSMNLTIDVPSYSEASSGRQGIGRELCLKNRRALRRAMLSHLIFNKPRALEN
jgi:hypothetical protein